MPSRDKKATKYTIGQTVSNSDYSSKTYYATSLPPNPEILDDDFYPVPSVVPYGKLLRTNMISTKNQSLIMLTFASILPTKGHITRWYDNPHSLWNHAKSAEHFKITTKDIDFGNPSRRKKIYKVYVTFKASSYMSGVIVKYSTDGSTSFTGTFNDTTYYSNTKGFDAFNAGSSSSEWITVALKPSASINNKYSLQLQFSFANAGRINKLTAGSGTSITLDNGANSNDDYYNGMPIYFYKNTGANDFKITDYVGSTRVATITPSLTSPVSTNTHYDLGYIRQEFEINDISIVYREKPIK